MKRLCVIASLFKPLLCPTSLKRLLPPEGLFPDVGVTKLLFNYSPEAHGHGKILGGGMVGTHAGDTIGEIALAI